MARINIEDSLFKDSRWWNLMIKLGCQYKGLGYLTKAWILAQEHWIEYKAIPLKAWPKELDILIEVELAEKTDDGFVYVKGSKKAFGWLEQRVEAGRKGGTKKRTKKVENSTQENLQNNEAKSILSNAVESGRLTKPSECQTCGNGEVAIEGYHSDYSNPLDVDWMCEDCNNNVHKSIKTEAVAKRSLEPVKPLTLPLTLSLSLSPSSNSSSSSFSNIPKRPNPNKELNLSIWEAYRNAYHSRYKVDPVRNASVNSKITQLANRLGAEAIEVIKFYLSHNDSFYLKNLHSIGLCLSNAESLRTQWLRNQPVTANDVKNFERKVNSIETQKALINGENF